jgi:hypothetical protein
MTFYKSVISPNNIGPYGVATIGDARRFATWLQTRLEHDYPEADIDVRASETEAEITRTDDEDDERPMRSIINELFTEWLATETSKAAATLGRKGGSVSGSPAKSAAATARNARRKAEGKPEGGRPPKTKPEAPRRG